MKFPYLLFDADDTLFDFPKAAARAFSAMCRSNGVPDTLDTRALYHRINQELWAAFDRGEVSKDYVTLERFVRFFQALKLPRDPDKCNRDYLTALGAGVYPLPHAQEVTGSSPVVSTKENPRAAKVLGFLFIQKILGLLVTCK